MIRSSHGERVETVTFGPPPVPGPLDAAFWRSRQGRRFLFQFVGSVVIFGLLLVATQIARGNLDRQNLTLSLDFLGRQAGMDMSETVLAYEPTDSLGWLMLAGAVNSLRVALPACLLATMLGFVVGVIRVSPNPMLRLLTGLYVNTIRSTPLLLQILFWYAILLQLPVVREAISFNDTVFLSQRGLQVPALLHDGGPWALPGALALACAVFVLTGRLPGRPVGGGLRALLGLAAGAGMLALLLGPVRFEMPEMGRFNLQGGATLTPEFTALIFALTLYAGAFIAELVRGGIEGVDRGQYEASASLGLSRLRILQLVILPQAMLAITPSVTTQYVSIIKNSSLAVAIGFPEFFWAVSIAINISGHSIEGLTVMMAGYLLPTLAAALLMNRLNRKMLERGQK